MGGEWVQKSPHNDGFDPGKSEMNEYSHAEYDETTGDMWDFAAYTDPVHRTQASLWATVWWGITTAQAYDKLKVDIEIVGSVHSEGQFADCEWTDRVRVFKKVDSNWNLTATSSVHREENADMNYAPYQQEVTYDLEAGETYRIQLHCRKNGGNSDAPGYANGDVDWETCGQGNYHLWFRKASW